MPIIVAALMSARGVIWTRQGVVRPYRSLAAAYNRTYSFGDGQVDISISVNLNQLACDDHLALVSCTQCSALHGVDDLRSE